MAQAVHARLDAHFGVDSPPAARHAAWRHSALRPRGSVGDRAGLRDFERRADGTVFQTFDWLAARQRHIGVRSGVTPAIVIGRDAGGILFILPLSTRAVRFARELTWLGSDLCDYNAPLLAPKFSERFDQAGFAALRAGVTQCLQGSARHRYDGVNLTKMPPLIRCA